MVVCMLPPDSTLPDSSQALLTDLYELTMLQAYQELGFDRQAVFSLFVRKLPQERNFLVSCGLDDVLGYLEGLRFSDQDISYLDSLNLFKDSFLDWLKHFRFQGDVFAVPEGTPVFANEPILEVKAPLPQAQLLESFIMNQVHFQTMAASKAARVVHAAGDRAVVDFGLRRIHGSDAGLKAARAFFAAGASGTSNVLAGKRFGIPVNGTMAHSYVQAFEDESEAFRSFASLYPGTILLIDTYDSFRAVDRIIELARRYGPDFSISGVRIDSSDLAELAGKVRSKLDSAGFTQVKIFASGSLDEYVVDRIVKQKAPVDGFGVGTKMGVSEDAPYLDMVYKLTAYGQKDKIKISPGKETLPGQKQVYRFKQNGLYTSDLISGFEESHAGEPLLHQVMQGGKRLAGRRDSLEQIRERALRGMEALPEDIRRLDQASPAFPVHISQDLAARQARLLQKLRA